LPLCSYSTSTLALAAIISVVECPPPNWNVERSTATECLTVVLLEQERSAGPGMCGAECKT